MSEAVTILRPGRELPRMETVRFPFYERRLQPGEVILCIAYLKVITDETSLGYVPILVKDAETLHAICSQTFTAAGIYKNFDLFAMKI